MVGEIFGAVITGAVALTGAYQYYSYLKSAEALSKAVNLATTPPSTTTSSVYGYLTGRAWPASHATPINCLNVAEKALVRHTIQTEQRLLYHQSTKTWTDSTRVISDNTESIPFFIQAGKISALVSNIASAVGLELKVVYDKFTEAPPPSATQVMADYFSGEKIKGVHTLEEILPIGTKLTVVGDISYNAHDGVFVIKPSSVPYSQYFVSSLSIEELHAKQLSTASSCKTLAIVFGTLSAGFLVYYFYPKIKLWWWRYTNSRQNNRNNNNNNNNGRNNNECVICLSTESNVAFTPCGHIATCLNCCHSVDSCPICRAHIDDRVRVYG